MKAIQWEGRIPKLCQKKQKAGHRRLRPGTAVRFTSRPCSSVRESAFTGYYWDILDAGMVGRSSSLGETSHLTAFLGLLSWIAIKIPVVIHWKYKRKLMQIDAIKTRLLADDRAHGQIVSVIKNPTSFVPDELATKWGKCSRWFSWLRRARRWEQEERFTTKK